MGLFGGKKEDKKMLTDYFSAEEIKTITDTIGTKLNSGEYGSLVQLTGKGLLDIIRQSEKGLSAGKTAKFFKIAESFRQYEPSLDGILRGGIDRFNSGK